MQYHYTRSIKHFKMYVHALKRIIKNNGGNEKFVRSETYERERETLETQIVIKMIFD